MPHPHSPPAPPHPQGERAGALHIAAWRKTTLLDYPGKIAALIYTAGCDLRCPWCHNPTLLEITPFTPRIAPQTILDHLEQRRGKLDGLAITGGEPLLWPGLPDFIRQVKALGYPVKTDTAGTHPQALRHLLEHHLVDYLAMDIKTAPEHAALIHARPTQQRHIAESLQLIKTSGVPHELRLTLLPHLHTESHLRALAPLTEGADTLVLQAFRPGHCLDPHYNTCPQTTPAQLQQAAPYFAPYVARLQFRP